MIGILGVLIILWDWKLKKLKKSVEKKENEYVRGKVKVMRKKV